MTKMEQVEALWQKFNDYKETAEQHEFVKLLFFDVKLNPGYKDLHENYSDEHADIFIRVLTNILNSLGVMADNMDYEIRIKMCPHEHDVKNKPYYWMIAKEDCNYGFGWSETPDKAWVDALRYYNRHINIMTVKDLIKDKDYDYISWRINLNELVREKVGVDDIFLGCCRSEGGKLISLDGDTYSENEIVLSYEEWSHPEHGIGNGLTVVVGGEEE